MRGLIGKKIGMARVFNSEGNAVPVTVLEVGPCHVIQVKTTENDLKRLFPSRCHQGIGCPS